MALKLTIEKIEDVEEALRSMYVEKEGKFHLDVDGLDALTTEAAKQARKVANKEAEQERLKRKEWEKLGKTPEELQAMVDEWTELQDLREKNQMTEAEKKGQWDQLKQQMNEKHAGEIKKKDIAIADEQKRVGDLRKSIEKHLIQSTAMSAIVQHKGIPDLLLPLVQRHIKVAEQEGEFIVKVVDDKGEPIVDGKGEPITIAEFVGEMQTNEVYGRAFQGTGSSGGGTRPANGGGQQIPASITRRADLKTERERSEFIDKYGLSTYTNLPM